MALGTDVLCMLRLDKYVLLADVVIHLSITRKQFLSLHGEIPTLKITWESFKLQTMLADFEAIERRIRLLVDGDKCEVVTDSLYYDNNKLDNMRLIDVIRFDSRLQRVLQIDLFTA